MPMLDSVMNLFNRPATQPGQGTQQPNPNGPQMQQAQKNQQDPAKQGSTVPGEGELGTDLDNPAAKKPEAVSRLDEFSKLWDDAPSTPEAEAAKGKPKGYLGMDPSKFKEHASKLNFASLADPALVAKALSGDTQSFTAVMNSVVQGVMAASLQASHTMIERGLTNADGKIWERFPGELKKHSLMDTGPSEDFPQANHPAVKPMYDNVRQQMAAKYPNSSTTELKSMTDRYMKAAFAAKDDGTNSAKVGTTAEERIRAASSQANDTDWMKEMQIDL